MQQPNVLFIITDQQRADHVGFMGNPVVRTPNIDAVAQQGLVFKNTWVSNPVCMPNRSTIMTGRMPTAHGVIFNDRSLDWGANTFVRCLRRAGYRTGLLGKSHLQHGMSKNAVVEHRGQGAIADPYPPGWNQVEDFEHYLEHPPEPIDDFYGFDTVELSIDHGARMSGHHLQWALEKGADKKDVFVEYAADAPGSKRSSNWWQIYQPPYIEELHSTSFVTERCINFMQSAVDEEKPFFAWCSFPDPHHPMTPPGEWFERHNPGDMVLPESRHDSLKDAPEHLRIAANMHPKEQRNWVAPCGYGDDELLREAIAATYGMIEMIDDRVGKLVDWLKQAGVADNTIIVFTSDHGDMMGDHGLFLKGFMHYRGTLQVPLVINTPHGKSGVTSTLASSIDLGPTVLDLCQVQGFDGMQGHSLEPVLNEDQASVRDYVLIEDDIADITAKLTPFPGKTRTLLSEHYRYTRNIKGEEQLFDLQADADEMHDLKSSNQELRMHMLDKLAQALIEADDAARGAPVAG